MPGFPIFYWANNPNSKAFSEAIKALFAKGLGEDSTMAGYFDSRVVDDKAFQKIIEGKEIRPFDPGNEIKTFKITED